MSQATSCRVCSKKRRRRGGRRRRANNLEVATTNKPRTTISTPTCSSFVRRLLSPESTISSSSLWRRYFTSSPLHNRVSKPQNETAVASRDHETIYRRSIRSNQTKRSVRIISDENFVLLVTNTTIENQEMFEMFENFLSLDATSSFCGDPDYEDFKREFVFAEWPNNNNRVKNKHEINQINQSTKTYIDQYSCNSNSNNNKSNKENRQQLVGVGRNSNIPIQERDGNRNNKSSRRSALMDINNNNTSIRSSSNNTNIINNNVSMSDLVVVKKNKMKNSKKRNTNTIKTTSSTYCSSVDADEEGYEGLVEYNYKSSINNNNNYNYNYNCNRNFNYNNNNNNVSYLNNNSIRSSENNKNNDNNELRRIIPSLIGWSNKIKTKQILKKSYILLGELKSIEIGRLNFFLLYYYIILYYYNYNYYNIYSISTTDFDDK